MDPLLAAKLALEDELKAPLLRLMRSYVVQAVAVNGQYGAHHVFYERKLIDLLLSHYARVVMVVTGRRPNNPQRLDEAVSSLEHLRSLTHRGHVQAGILLRGLDREVVSGVEIKAEGLGMGSRVLAKAREVMARVRARITAIVTGQTNGPAEEAREIEARRSAGNRALYKEWSTMLDAKVRDTHRDAEGQIRLVTEPYEVGDSRLMFPGDTSLRADLKEVINCRCASKFFTRDENGVRVELAETTRLTPVSPNRTVRTITNPFNVTTAVRLQEGMVQEVFLADLQSARVSIRQGVIRITRAGQRLAIGRFTHGMIRGPRVEGMVYVSGADQIGIQELIARSISR
jgi:hypothetical protein